VRTQYFRASSSNTIKIANCNRHVVRSAIHIRAVLSQGITYSEWKEDVLDRDTPGKESIVEKRYVAEEEAECQSCNHGRDDVLVACPRVADKGVLEQGQAARPGGQEVSRDVQLSSVSAVGGYHSQTDLPPLHDDQREKVDTLSLVDLFGDEIAIESSSEATISSDDILERHAISFEVPVSA
jgi:hypothetical protein